MPKIILNSFRKGITLDRTQLNGFSYGRNLNIRKDVDTLSCNNSSLVDYVTTTIDALPIQMLEWMVGAELYIFCSNGKIFKRIVSTGATTLVYTDTDNNILDAASFNSGQYTWFVWTTSAHKLHVKRMAASNTEPWNDVDTNTPASGTYPKTLYGAATDAGHPIKLSHGDLYIGNGYKVAKLAYSDGSFADEAFSFDLQYHASCFAENGNYLLTGTTDVNDSCKAAIFAHDYLSLNYISRVITTYDTINAISDSSTPIVLADGKLFELDRLSGYSDAPVVGNIGKVYNNGITHGTPTIFSNHRSVVDIDGLTLFGCNLYMSLLYGGVYSYGSNRVGLPKAFNLEYSIDDMYQIGFLKIIRNTLYMGFKQNGAYRIAKLTIDTPKTSVYISPIIRVPDSIPFSDVVWDKVVLKTKPLGNNCSITARAIEVDGSGTVDYETYYNMLLPNKSTSFINNNESAQMKECTFLWGRRSATFEFELTLTPYYGISPEITQIEVYFHL